MSVGTALLLCGTFRDLSGFCIRSICDIYIRVKNAYFLENTLNKTRQGAEIRIAGHLPGLGEISGRLLLQGHECSQDPSSPSKALNND